jgi:UDP:flavonoid glycosyltransferase YjiC (YdhE family)
VTKPLRVLLIGLGSAGDVHPGVGVGMALKKRGHDVTLMAVSVFRELAAQAGLDFFGLGKDEEHHAILRNPDLWRPRKAFPLIAKYLILKFVRPIYEFIEQNYEPGRTVVVSPATALGARIAHEKLGVPLATVHLQPSMIRSSLSPPTYMIPDITAPMPVWLRRLYYRFADRFVIDPLLAEEVNGFRRELQLPPIRNFFDRWMHSPQMVIALFPEWFAPRAADWPPNVHHTGFPLWDEADLRSRVPELEAFLGGDSPYVFTAGTANVHAQAFFRAATEACLLGNRRGILLTRFPEQLPASLPKSVRHFDYIPFSHVLPRAAAFVHHGGIGTMAQGFVAGTPQLVMPLAHDQFDNAMRARRLGCGDFLLPKKFTPRAVHEKLESLLGSEQVATNTKKWAAALRNTNTLERTCDLVEGISGSDYSMP